MQPLISLLGGVLTTENHKEKDQIIGNISKLKNRVRSAINLDKKSCDAVVVVIIHRWKIYLETTRSITARNIRLWFEITMQGEDGKLGKGRLVVPGISCLDGWRIAKRDMGSCSEGLGRGGCNW